jgi:hypothetical protein
VNAIRAALDDYDKQFAPWPSGVPLPSAAARAELAVKDKALDNSCGHCRIGTYHNLLPECLKCQGAARGNS